MNLSGNQLKIIHEALLSAYTSHAQLAKMVRFELDENLDRIGGNGTLDEVAFKLVEWANANGKVKELIAGAVNQNSGNLQMASLAEVIEFWGKKRGLNEPVGSVEKELAKQRFRSEVKFGGYVLVASVPAIAVFTFLNLEPGALDGRIFAAIATAIVFSLPIAVVSIIIRGIILKWFSPF